jgi:hypothetical protein
MILTLSLSGVFTASGHPACCSFPFFMACMRCTYIYISVYVNVQENSCPYISTSPHPWLLQDGVPVLGLSPRRFFSEGCLPKIIMTVSSLAKGTMSPSMGASSTSMP